MADFVLDTLTDTDGQNLESHVGETGAAWTIHPSYGGAGVFKSNRLYATATTAYYSSGVPASADYFAEGVFYAASIIAVNNAITVRMSISADTMYLLRLNNGTVWEVRKIVAGVATTLTTDSTAGNLPTVGNSKTAQLIINGTNITVTIDGVNVPALAVSDPDISAAGRMGVRFAGAASATTGFHLDSVRAGSSMMPSISPSASRSPSTSVSPSMSPSASRSPSASQSMSPSASRSPSASISPSGSKSPSSSASPSGGGEWVCALPAVTPVVTMPSLTGANIVTVKASGGTYTLAQLQTAINNAVADVAANNRVNIIKIENSADITSATPYTLPIGANPNNKVIIIQAEDLTSLPAVDVRVIPSTHAPFMPKLRQSGANQPVFDTAYGNGTNIVNNWRFIGLEITTTLTTTTPNALVALGENLNTWTSAARIPQKIIIDRCYIHGSTTNAAAVLSRAVALHCGEAAIVNCNISDVHNAGSDAQCVWMNNGPGPYLIENNYLEASGENIMSGGEHIYIANNIPSDITIRKNEATKKLEWKFDEEQYVAGAGGVKNIFELKNAARVLYEGNYMHNSWVSGQQGWAFTFTPRNQYGDTTWCKIEDVTVRYNVIESVNRGVDMITRDDQPGFVSGYLLRVDVHDNLFVKMNTPRWGGRGDFMIPLSLPAFTGPNFIRAAHNTIPDLFVDNGAIVSADLNTTTDWIFRDNIITIGAYGWFASGYSQGNNAMALFTGMNFTKNAVIGGNATIYNNYAGNFFPPLLSDIGFQNLATRDWRLNSGSAYHNAATDGVDLGANIAAIEAATGKTVPLADKLPPWITGVAASPTSVTASIDLISDEDCNVYAEYGLTTAYGSVTGTNAALAGILTTLAVTGLTKATVYHYRIRAVDAAGNAMVGKDRTFTTATAGSPSASMSPSASRSPSASTSPSLSPSASGSPSPSRSPSASISPSVSPSSSPSASISRSPSPSASASPSYGGPCYSEVIGGVVKFDGVTIATGKQLTVYKATNTVNPGTGAIKTFFDGNVRVSTLLADGTWSPKLTFQCGATVYIYLDSPMFNRYKYKGIPVVINNGPTMTLGELLLQIK